MLLKCLKNSQWCNIYRLVSCCHLDRPMMYLLLLALNETELKHNFFFCTISAAASLLMHLLAALITALVSVFQLAAAADVAVTLNSRDHQPRRFQYLNNSEVKAGERKGGRCGRHTKCLLETIFLNILFNPHIPHIEYSSLISRQF